MGKRRILTSEEQKIYDEATRLANRLNQRLQRFDVTTDINGDYKKAIKLARAYKYLQANGKYVRKSYKSMDSTYVKQVIIPALTKSLEDNKGNQKLLKIREEELDEKKLKVLKDFRKGINDTVEWSDVRTYFNAMDLTTWREMTDNLYSSETDYEVIDNAKNSNFTYNGKTGFEAYLEEYADKIPVEKQSKAHFVNEYFKNHPTIKGRYKYN